MGNILHVHCSGLLGDRVLWVSEHFESIVYLDYGLEIANWVSQDRALGVSIIVLRRWSWNGHLSFTLWHWSKRLHIHCLGLLRHRGLWVGSFNQEMALKWWFIGGEDSAHPLFRCPGRKSCACPLVRSPRRQSFLSWQTYNGTMALKWLYIGEKDSVNSLFMCPGRMSCACSLVRSPRRQSSGLQ